MVLLPLVKGSEVSNQKMSSCIWERESWILFCVIDHKSLAEAQQLNIYYKQ